jgi:hypothetical protein
MGRIVIPPPEQVEPFIGATLGALTWSGGAPTDLQLDLVQSVVDRFSGGRGPRVRDIDPIEAEVAQQRLDDPRLRQQLANLVIVLELIMHPLPPELERHAERYLVAAGVHSSYLSIVRDTAEGHLARLHADLLRNSWYTAETMRGLFKGRLGEMVRSKLAYYSIGTDEKLAAKWRALEDCPDGSWGREVARFYRLHGFPFPGEAGGIYEIGALHDWVHVLADYGTSPEGEIDVFAFIAATMEDERGFIQFVFTLALFQNASVDTVGGKHIPIARADTLSDPGAIDRLADAFWRATHCSADVMGGVDHFALAATPLDELRARWDIPEKGQPSPGAFDVPAPIMPSPPAS